MKELIEKYKAYLILEKSLSSNSVDAYLNDIEKFTKYCMENHKVVVPEGVTSDILVNYLQHIETIGITDRTKARLISGIRSFFNFLVYDGVLPENPAKLLETPKIQRLLPEILTDEERHKILNAIQMYKPEGQRNKAIIEVLYYCGLRVSELINLKLSNIDFRQGTLRVEGKGNKNRIIPLNNNANIEIKRYLKVYRDYLNINEEYRDILFLNKKGLALSRVAVYNIINDSARHASIEKKISPQTFRHAFAFNLVSKGTDLYKVQHLLGHESSMTTEIYYHTM